MVKHKKRKHRILKSFLALIGIFALSLTAFSIYALIYSYIYENPLMYLGIGLGILFIIVLLGGMSWKKIKAKIKDIIT
jgi:Na+/proline symporter